MATWNSAADWRRAGAVAAVVAAYVAGVVAAALTGTRVGEYARTAWHLQDPAPAFRAGWGWEVAVVAVGQFGPLAAFVAGVVRGWPWWRAALVPLTVGLVAAAAVLLTATWGDRVGGAAVVAHLGLSAGMIGGGVAWVRGRLARRGPDPHAAAGDEA